MSEQTTLTDEQREKLDDMIKEWEEIGFCTDPIDREKAKEAVFGVYREFGQEIPQFVAFAESPASACLLIACVKMSDKIEDINYDALSEECIEFTRQNHEKFTDVDFRKESIRKIALKLPGVSEDTEVPDFHLTDQIYGCHDAGWCCFYDFYDRVMGSEQIQQLRCFYEAAKHSGWYAPYENFVCIQNRPSHFEVEHSGDQWRHHNDTGPAVGWRDGFAVWNIHGNKVDRQIVMEPETQTLDQIDNEPNEEVKRIRIERFGWHRYLEAKGAKAIDSRQNAVDGTKESLFEGFEGEYVLMTHCPSTARIYGLEVPRVSAETGAKLDTCEKAQRWLAGEGVFEVGNCVGSS